MLLLQNREKLCSKRVLGVNMWRFILATFAFLGWAFYSVSGGADYQPAEGSLQAQKSKDVKVTKLGAAESQDDATKLAENTDKSSTAKSDVVQAVLTTTQANASVSSVSKDGKDAEQVEIAQAENIQNDAAEGNADVAVTRVEFDSALDAFKGGAKKITEVRSTGDIRQVKGSNVNLRSGPGTDYDRVGQLGSGTKVEVIGSGDSEWVELKVVDTGKIGWMANRLLTVAN